MKTIFASFLALSFISFLGLTGCASHGTVTSSAREELENKWSPRVGKAKKGDFVEEFGPAEWCKQDTGGEEVCRFYRSRGTKKVGEKGDKDRKQYEAFDQIIATFDTNGTLRNIDTSAQR